MKQWYPIKSFFFFREEIHYVHDGFFFFFFKEKEIWLCAMVDGMRYIECMAAPETIQSRPPDWSSGLAIPFVFLRQQDPPPPPVTNLESNPSYSKARFKLAVWLKVASPSSSTLSDSSRISCEEGNTSTLHSIQTEGAGDCRPPRDSDVQAKAMGHQGSPLTEATSDGWDRPTLVYRPSCPGYFTAEPVPSPELDSTDELTCNSKTNMYYLTNCIVQAQLLNRRWSRPYVECAGWFLDCDARKASAPANEAHWVTRVMWSISQKHLLWPNYTLSLF